MSQTQQNLTITLFGETRTFPVWVLEFEDGRSRADSGFNEFVGRIGRGTKNHSMYMSFWPAEGEGRNVGQTEDGRYWKASFSGHALNRQGVITGFADKLGMTSEHSRERL